MDGNVALGKRVSVSCDLSRSNDWSKAPVGLSDGETDAISADKAWSCSKDRTVRDQRSYQNVLRHGPTQRGTHTQDHQAAEKEQTANRKKKHPDFSGWDSNSEGSLW